MTGLIGAIIVGILIGIVGTNVYLSKPVRREAPNRYFRKRATGEDYRYCGRADLIGTKVLKAEVLLLAPTVRSGQEAWPEKLVEIEFEEITEDQFIDGTGLGRTSR